MSDGFNLVTRKKWLARRSLQKSRKPSEKIYDNIQVDLDEFEKRIECLCTKMSETDYFKQSINTLEESLREVPTIERLEEIICFGIGPFTRNFQALHQLAFILSAQRQLKIAKAIFYDPIFSGSEKDLLQRLKCNVMAENSEGKYQADVATLFYLPHCPNSLTNNLLWSNWRLTNIQNSVIINNSFESLAISKPKRLLLQDSNYILDIIPYMKEHPLDDDYEVNNVFNDLSVHVFPIENLPLENSNFWLQRETPKYNTANNDEMIAAEDIEKLKIS